MYLYGMRHLLLLLAVCVIISSCKESLPEYNTTQADAIRLNQIGYYPNASKKAIITEPVSTTTFYLIDQQTKEKVFEGNLSDSLTWNLAGETVRVADFSEFTTTGNYNLYIDNLGYSYPFEIKTAVLADAFTASVKSLYYQHSMNAAQKFKQKKECASCEG